MLVADPPWTNSTTRKNSPACNPPLSIRVISTPIMQFLKYFSFRMFSFKGLNSCIACSWYCEKYNSLPALTYPQLVIKIINKTFKYIHLKFCNFPNYLSRFQPLRSTILGFGAFQRFLRNTTRSLGHIQAYNTSGAEKITLIAFPISRTSNATERKKNPSLILAELTSFPFSLSE